MIPAHIERLMQFAQYGQPAGYAASDMMRKDMIALIEEYCLINQTLDSRDRNIETLATENRRLIAKIDEAMAELPEVTVSNCRLVSEQPGNFLWILKMKQSLIKELEAEIDSLKLSKIDQECLNIGQAIYRAAGDLPDGWNIEIDIERGYGGIKLITPEYDAIDFDDNDGQGMSYCIEKAINTAIQRGEK